MSAIFFILLGMVLAVAIIAAWIIYLELTSASRVEAQLARMEDLRAERRLQAITQHAVDQMLRIARQHQ